MAYTLNTGHALYGNLVELIGVQSGALVSCVTARTFTKHANASYSSGTWGEHLHTVANGYTAQGATFTPTLQLNTSTYTNNTLVLVLNSASTSGIGSVGAMFASSHAGSYSVGMTGGALPTSVESQSTLHVTGSGVINTAPHMLAIAKTSEASHELFVDGVSNFQSNTRLSYNSSSTYWDSIGGVNGQCSVTIDLVWAALFNKVCTAAELLSLYNSLGASNTFGLVTSGGSAFKSSFAGNANSIVQGT